MGVLGGFASAVLLLVVAVLMAGESLHRLFAPEAIRFDEAILIAVIGLVVNLVCALLLKDDHHHHGHGHGHSDHPHEHSAHGHSHHGHDLNLRAAYLHVLADAFTSVTAIVALLVGKFYGWAWLDSVMGLVGSAVVSAWAYGLIRDTSGILLDRTPESSDLPTELRRAVEEDGNSMISDLHVWQVSPGRFSAIISVVADDPKPIEFYREKFREHEELVHITIEVHQCPGDHTPEAAVA
jgi:cation diffusion facilitator family transporter